MCARVRTLLRRVQKFSTPSLTTRCGDFELNELAAQITRFGMPLNLTRYEFLLLKTFADVAGTYLLPPTTDGFSLGRCAGYLDRTVDTHIKTLRPSCGAINPSFPHQYASRYGIQPEERLMRIGMRLLLGYFLIVAVAARFVLSIFVQEIKPCVRRATEGH